MPSPWEQAFPAVIDKENAVDLSTISREALVDELFAPNPCPHALQASRATCARDPGGAIEPAREQRVRHILAVAKELLLRDLQRDCRRQPVLDDPKDLCDWLRLRCAGLEHEIFLVVYLDTHLRLLDAEEIARGTLTQTSVYPREVVKAALAHNAAAVAFAHNHPSGSPEPSRADELLTTTLKSALALVDVRVVDHVVVAGAQTVSFAQRGLL